MDTLLEYIKTEIQLSSDLQIKLVSYFELIEVKAKTILVKTGITDPYVYFLSQGIVRGYQNKDGKIVVGHLVESNAFFGSIESFMDGLPALDYFESLTNCKILKISKTNFETLSKLNPQWDNFAKGIISTNLKCKMERIEDFQVLTAKDRYLKFLKQSPNLAQNVSIENIASFLGMEPQSLSRIRKQITF